MNRAFKNSSVQLILDFGKEFEDMEDYRKAVSKFIISSNILDEGDIKPLFDFERVRIRRYLWFFLIRLGFLFQEEYLKADIVHHYFDFWFRNYYQFYQQYKNKATFGLWVDCME